GHQADRGVVGGKPFRIDSAVRLLLGQEETQSLFRSCGNLGRIVQTGIAEKGGNGEAGDGGVLRIAPRARFTVLLGFEEFDALLYSPLDLEFQGNVAVAVWRDRILGGSRYDSDGIECENRKNFHVYLDTSEEPFFTALSTPFGRIIRVPFVPISGITLSFAPHRSSVSAPGWVILNMASLSR